MELSVYLEILKRRAWVIVFVTTLAVLVVTLIGLGITPVYTARATVRVILDVGLTDFTVRDDYTERLLNTYRDVLLSQPFLEKAVERTPSTPAGLAMSDLAEHVTVEVVPNTELIGISVVDRDRVFATDLANAMAGLLEEYPQTVYTGRGKSTAQIVQDQLADVDAKLAASRKQLAELLAQGRPAAETDELQSQIRFHEESYNKLLDSYETVRLNEALRSNSIMILAPAVAPAQPSNNIGLTEIALGMVLGLLGGVALALVMENLDTRIHSAQQVEYMTNLPVFGVVPRGLVPPGSFEQADSPPNQQAIKEAYRVLIPNMKIFAKRETTLRSILITSPTIGDHKSEVAVNLSQAIAEQGQQLFLVETDLRTPELGKTFSVNAECGLSDLLDSSAPLDDLLHPTLQPNLFLITGGSKVLNPTT
ncbi:MAG: Wzz/FepE/Etk N-terminal domain-containing protein, partial [Chloroflexota bacterium]